MMVESLSSSVTGGRGTDGNGLRCIAGSMGMLPPLAALGFILGAAQQKYIQYVELQTSLFRDIIVTPSYV